MDTKPVATNQTTSIERALIVERYKKSGQSIMAFARENNLRHQTLWNWVRGACGKKVKMKPKHLKQPSEPTFYPIKVTSSKQASKLDPDWLAVFLKSLNERDLL